MKYQQLLNIIYNIEKSIYKNNYNYINNINNYIYNINKNTNTKLYNNIYDYKYIYYLFNNNNNLKLYNLLNYYEHYLQGLINYKYNNNIISRLFNIINFEYSTNNITILNKNYNNKHFNKNIINNTNSKEIINNNNNIINNILYLLFKNQLNKNNIYNDIILLKYPYLDSQLLNNYIRLHIYNNNRKFRNYYLYINNIIKYMPIYNIPRNIHILNINNIYNYINNINKYNIILNNYNNNGIYIDNKILYNLLRNLYILGSSIQFKGSKSTGDSNAKSSKAIKLTGSLNNNLLLYKDKFKLLSSHSNISTNNNSILTKNGLCGVTIKLSHI